jgi:urease subunit alpha
MKLLAVKNCRSVFKKDIVRNESLSHLEVDLETYAVKADGVRRRCAPAEVIPHGFGVIFCIKR